MGKNRGKKRAAGGHGRGEQKSSKTAGQIFREGFDVSKTARQRSEAAAAAPQRAGVGGRAISKNAGKRARRKESRKDGTREGGKRKDNEVDKAVRRACREDNLSMILSCTNLPWALTGAAGTLTLVVELLVKHARLREAAALLRAPDLGSATLSFASITAALQCVPQTLRTCPGDAVAFLSSTVAGRSSFYEVQATSVLLEFVTEAGSALDARVSQPVGSLVRSGRTCITRRVSPGMKPGEMLCERDAESAAVDRERRGLQAGDCVAVSALSNESRDAVGDGFGGGFSYGGGGYGGGGFGGGGNGGGNGGNGGGDGDASSTVLIEADVAVGLPLVLRLPSAETASALVASGRPLRIDKLANRVSYRRQLAAISTVLEARERARSDALGQGSQGGGHGADGSKERSKEAQRPSSALAAIICARSSGAPRSAVETLCSGLVSPQARELVLNSPDPTFRRLNGSQQAACAAAAGNTLTLVQGPPGTGKYRQG